MKVTALIPDPLVREVRELAQGKTLTESLLRALVEWTATKKSIALAERVRAHPLTFRREAVTGKLRELNRRR